MPAEADPALVEIWAQGWALTREVAPPIAVPGGWRIEVGLPDQVRRFVYPAASEAVAERGRAVSQPFEFIKVATSLDAVRQLLDDRWALGPPGYMMTRDPIMVTPSGTLRETLPLPCGDRVGRGAAANDAARGDPSPRPTPLRGVGEVAAHYRLVVDAITDGLTLATILAPDGELAASGRVGVIGDVAIYDRIRVQDAHQRRGLGRALMIALGKVADRAGASRWVLVATPEGRALYETLGWELHSPYTTAFIPPA
jgi:GNAT superfamily N-acetyltransferase